MKRAALELPNLRETTAEKKDVLKLSLKYIGAVENEHGRNEAEF